jgi:predicted GNAT family acetyltransferase
LGAAKRINDGGLYLWIDGEPVSMAARVRETAHGSAVSAVYTPPQFRGRGYATSCVGELCRQILHEGRRFCALFADLANPVSNSIYQRIGFRQVADFDQVHFS